MTAQSPPPAQVEGARRITMLVTGSLGDVRPQIALGLALQASGHRVTMATHQLYADQIGKLGLGFKPLEVNPRQLLETEAGMAWVASQTNPVKSARTMVSLLRPIFRDLLDDSWRACQDTDALVCSNLANWGYDIAESLGVPCVFTPVYPMRRTRSFPAIGAEPLPLGPAYNLLTHFLYLQANWLPFRRIWNQWRADDLGLAPEPFWGGQRLMGWPHVPVVYGFSPSVFPKPADWEENQHIAGYWFFDEDRKDWQPPPALVDFLDAGPPPVYVGFGSMTDPDPERLVDTVLAALRLAGQRAVVLGGWANLSADLPAYRSDDVVFVDAIPHSWLFPRMSAIVHHGGAGTTGAALRAGVPSVPVPHFFDQTLWGHRLAQLGAGTRPLARRKLTARRLAAAISTAGGDPSLRAGAQDLRDRIQAEDGLAKAVALINNHLSRAGPTGPARSDHHRVTRRTA